MHFYDNKKKIGAKFAYRRTGVIILRAWIKGKKTEISTGIKWPKDFFNSEAGIILPRSKQDRQYYEASKKLFLLISKAESILPNCNSIYDFQKAMSTGEDLTIQEFANDVISSKSNLSQATHRAYSYWLIMGLQDLQHNPPLSQINKQFAENLDTAMRQHGRAANTRANIHTLFKLVLATAYRKQIIQINPYSQFPIAREETAKKAISLQELQAAYNLYKDGKLPDNLHYTLRIFLISCYTGLRAKDLTELDYQKHVKQGKLHKYTSKSRYKKKAIIPLTNKSQELLEGITPSKYTLSYLTNKLMPLLSEHLGFKVTFHAGRHTFATMLANITNDPFLVKMALGHSDINISLTYVRTDENKLKEALQKLSEFS